MSDLVSENQNDQNGHRDIRLTEGSDPISVINSPLSDVVDSSGTGTKRTWVKFDDETEEVKNKINENNLSNALGGEQPAIASTETHLTTTTKTSPLEANKLSPPPPSQKNVATPAVKERQRLPFPSSAPMTTSTTATASQITSKTRSKSPVQSPPTISASITPAVLTTESTHVNLSHTSSTTPEKPVPLTNITNTNKTTSNNATSPTVPKHDVSVPIGSTMRTIELSTGTIREGFANGDVIVTLLPCNTKWPWVTPAIFRPELVPEELMAQGLTLTVEEYVNAMETLVNDYRFTLYNICYKRILVCWILFAFCVLLTMLFSGLQGVALFSLGVAWLFLNAAAIFLCMWMKLRLSRGLEKCLARVNKQLIKHKIILVLDDRGKISCHKVNLCFLYFDSTQCVEFLNSFLEHTEQNGHNLQAGWEAKLDLDVNDIVIQGSNPMRLSRKQEFGWRVYLRYASRWGFDALNGHLNVTPFQPGRHCSKYLCPCQYIKEHISCKPEKYPCNCIAYLSDPNFQNRY
ncbi:uncharacterized protein LOC129905908 isoform X2 [Episyrphus balteatus]|uniref:uncharacterized protein LOC129905908 isoform X2 n=1 Tax=Episyrphus balteatus TaxID=286459 RepID=UPI002486BD71|nr:uncharacterized protein LOC129905908 isoform X2 [Episyrphus balteatus]